MSCVLAHPFQLRQLDCQSALPAIKTDARTRYLKPGTVNPGGTFVPASLLDRQLRAATSGNEKDDTIARYRCRATQLSPRSLGHLPGEATR